MLARVVRLRFVVLPRRLRLSCAHRRTFPTMASEAAVPSSAASSDVPPSGAARGVLFLQEKKVPFEIRDYAYVEKGGTGASSSALGVSEHAIIKTLLFQEADDVTPFIVLQHGDASVDTKKLVKELQRTRGRTSGSAGEGVDPLADTPPSKKPRAFMTSPETAQKHTGYQVGGTSPFGVKDQTLRVFIEASLLTLAPQAAPETVQPTKPEDAQRRDEQVAAWDSQIASAPLLVDFTQLDTRTAKASLLDLASPAWVLINGGARGTLVALSVRDIVRVLRPIVISVGKTAAADGDEKALGGKKSQQAQQKATAAAAEAEAAAQ